MALLSNPNMMKQLAKMAKIGRLTAKVAVVTLKNPPSKDRTIGRLTYETLKDMGPTFVKIGQFISTRSDIFGKEFTDELKELQDNVAPMASHEIAPLIEGIKSKVKDVTLEPLAAASIGQVHYGVLDTGEQVAIKFKRVGIDETIHADFKLLLSIISFLKSIVINRQITEVEISLREYYQLLQEEINFRNEVQNMKAFKEKCASVKHIKVPKPYEALCSDDVIVMEYVPSIKINDIETIDKLKFNKERISEKLLESFFTQIVDYGFVHIDPHPGNVGITEQGKIVFYDYGMFVRLDNSMRSNLKALFLAMYDRDVEEVCNILVDLGIVLVDPPKIPSFRKFIASFLSYLDTLDVNNFKVSYLDRIDQSEMQFLISSKMILLLRGITILEGVCKNLHPSFNYREILDPFISEFIVDIEYIERRGKKDLFKLTKASDKITTSEISLNLVESDVTILKQELLKSSAKTRYAFMALAVSLWIQCDSVESKSIVTLAFLYVLVNK